MMMTLLSEASFLGFEGTEATFFKTFFAAAAFFGLWIYGALCKNYAKTMMGEMIWSILAWIGGIGIVICSIVEIVCAIKIF